MLRRRAGWLATHSDCMGWSYIGLLAATATEIVTRAPLGLVHDARSGLTIGLIATAVFIVIGFIVLPRLQARALGYQRGD